MFLFFVVFFFHFNIWFQIAVAKDGNLDSPIFEFVDGRSKDLNGWVEHSLEDDGLLRMSLSDSSSPGASLDEAAAASSTFQEEELTEEFIFD